MGQSHLLKICFPIQQKTGCCCYSSDSVPALLVCDVHEAIRHRRTLGFLPSLVLPHADVRVQDVGMGALYLASKLEECPLRMRDLINVYDLLLQRAAHSLAHPPSSEPPSTFKYAPMSYFGSTFYDLKDALVVAEMQILKRLGFNVHVVLPYGTLVNYLRVLGLTNREDACARAWGYLNDALVSDFDYTQFNLLIALSAAAFRPPYTHCMRSRRSLAPLSCSLRGTFTYRHQMTGGRCSMRRGRMCGLSAGT